MKRWIGSNKQWAADSEPGAVKITKPRNRARAKIFFLCALCVLCGEGLAAQTVARNLAWDFGVAPSTDVLCGATVTQDCIDKFEVAYESAPGVFTVAATPAASVCVARTPAGWTCTVPIPAVPGRKYKSNTWIARAVSSDGVRSLDSNSVTVQLPPGTLVVRASP